MFNQNYNIFKNNIKAKNELLTYHIQKLLPLTKEEVIQKSKILNAKQLVRIAKHNSGLGCVNVNRVITELNKGGTSFLVDEQSTRVRLDNLKLIWYEGHEDCGDFYRVEYVKELFEKCERLNVVRFRLNDYNKNDTLEFWQKLTNPETQQSTLDLISTIHKQDSLEFDQAVDMLYNHLVLSGGMEHSKFAINNNILNLTDIINLSAVDTRVSTTVSVIFFAYVNMPKIIVLYLTLMQGQNLEIFLSKIREKLWARLITNNSFLGYKKLIYSYWKTPVTVNTYAKTMLTFISSNPKVLHVFTTLAIPCLLSYVSLPSTSASIVPHQGLNKEQYKNWASSFLESLRTDSNPIAFEFGALIGSCIDSFIKGLWKTRIEDIKEGVEILKEMGKIKTLLISFLGIMFSLVTYSGYTSILNALNSISIKVDALELKLENLEQRIFALEQKSSVVSITNNPIPKIDESVWYIQTFISNNASAITNITIGITGLVVVYVGLNYVVFPFIAGTGLYKFAKGVDGFIGTATETTQTGLSSFYNGVKSNINYYNPWQNVDTSSVKPYINPNVPRLNASNVPTSEFPDLLQSSVVDSLPVSPEFDTIPEAWLPNINYGTASEPISSRVEDLDKVKIIEDASKAATEVLSAYLDNLF